MTKTDAKNIAKKILQDAIGTAYYRLETSWLYADSMSDEEEKMVLDYINQYGKSACKAFGRKYVTY